ncbi:hypothetical protein [Hymenobacter sp. BT559]|uniref:hypothetical protein n=1 Tax=Hymenobacter sp. BT559 TaxID=2795729 RepID=UPI0018ECA46A|nr:hypothetical protein [Hymenobacter sp. BT559]MBJ6143958.1 hypothetical protein [Hymenobacter sp. BT559]
MNRLFLLLGLAGLLLAAGCRKDDLVDCTPATSNLSLQEFIKRNGVPVQTFTLTLGPNSGNQTLTTNAGATITFPGSRFILPNGTAASGSAQVRVREIYSVPDMLLSNMPTQVIGTRQLLISGGEFSIQVWQNGTRLRLAAGSSRIVVNSIAPVGAASGQQLVWQQLANPTPDSAAWSRPGTLDTVRTNTFPNGVAPVYSMPISLDSVSWWNIDRLWSLYQSAPVRTITVQVPAIPAASTGSTQVFIRVTGLNGLARLYPSNTAKTNWVAQLPTGANMVVAVLQSVNGQLYFGSQPLTTQNGLVITPTLTAVSEADAVRLIKQL